MPICRATTAFAIPKRASSSKISRTGGCACLAARRAKKASPKVILIRYERPLYGPKGQENFVLGRFLVVHAKLPTLASFSLISPLASFLRPSVYPFATTSIPNRPRGRRRLGQQFSAYVGKPWAKFSWLFRPSDRRLNMSSMEYALSPPSEASCLRGHSKIPGGVTNNSLLGRFLFGLAHFNHFAFLRASTNDL